MLDDAAIPNGGNMTEEANNIRPRFGNFAIANDTGYPRTVSSSLYMTQGDGDLRAALRHRLASPFSTADRRGHQAPPQIPIGTVSDGLRSGAMRFNQRENRIWVGVGSSTSAVSAITTGMC
jgi:hypothetical protein